MKKDSKDNKYIEYLEQRHQEDDIEIRGLKQVIDAIQNSQNKVNKKGIYRLLISFIIIDILVTIIGGIWLYISSAMFLGQALAIVWYLNQK